MCSKCRESFETRFSNQSHVRWHDRATKLLEAKQSRPQLLRSQHLPDSSSLGLLLLLQLPLQHIKLWLDSLRDPYLRVSSQQGRRKASSLFPLAVLADDSTRVWQIGPVRGAFPEQSSREGKADRGVHVRHLTRAVLST